MSKSSAATFWEAGQLEQRDGTRYNVHFLIDVRHKSEGSRVGHVINLGTKGMAVISKQLIEPQTELALRLEANLESSNKQIAELNATVIYVVDHTRPGLYIIGFQFGDLTPKARIRIKNIIRALQQAR